jgi:DNA-binding response OmpR family regulator
MTAAPAGPSDHTGTGSSPQTQPVSLLLYSDDVTTRDAVRLAVGRRPSRDVEVASWRECATQAAVVEAVEAQHFDLLILDGEATPLGGMGLCRQLKNEIYRCPPVLVLTGRVQDGWLAAWSQADAVVPHPLDPVAVAKAVATLVRADASA